MGKGKPTLALLVGYSLSIVIEIFYQEATSSAYGIE